MVELLKLVLAMALVAPPADQPVVELSYAFAMNTVVRDTAGQRVPLTAISPAGFSEDEHLTIKWVPSAAGGIYVWVINKSNVPAEVQWGSSRYIAPDGVTHPVVHQGTGLGSPGEAQAPTILPPGAKLADVMIPTAHLTFVKPGPATTGGWHVHNILPTKVQFGKETDVVQALKGRSIQALLAVSQANVVRRYQATFVISGIKAELLPMGPQPAPSTAVAEQPSPDPAPSVAPVAVPEAQPQPEPTPSAAPTVQATPRPEPTPRPSKDPEFTRDDFRKEYM